MKQFKHWGLTAEQIKNLPDVSTRQNSNSILKKSHISD